MLLAAAAKSLQSCLTLQPYRPQSTKLRHPWDSPCKNVGVGCHFLLQCMKVKSESEVTQSCPTLRDPMDCSPPGSSIHGIFQARILEWVAIAFSEQIFLTRDQTQVSCIDRWILYHWATWEAQIILLPHNKAKQKLVSCIKHLHLSISSAKIFRSTSSNFFFFGWYFVRTANPETPPFPLEFQVSILR